MKSYSGGIRHDYKESASVTDAARDRRWSWFALGLCLPVVGVSLFFISEPNESMVTPGIDTRLAYVESSPVVGPTTEKLRLPPPRSAPGIITTPTPNELHTAALSNQGTVLDLRIASGDSLDRLFRRHDLSASDLAAMVALPDARPHLVRLTPGDEIRVSHDEGRVLSLTREISDDTRLWITRDDNGFTSSEAKLEIETRSVGAHGTIENSLFEAGMNAGIADDVIMLMASIFQWDIDFIQDVRTGDSFTVIYEERWRDGIKLGNGGIVAAEFVNQGQVYRAARYVDGNGKADHYTPEGRSVRKAFIRAPVEFTRISSSFNPSRRHPVLNTIRAHRGVDYAAPTGTPVLAAGDGRVEFRGVNGGFGNAIVLRHGGNISTLYGHLARFGSFRTGSRVSQGDVIGYVGQSGLATGPHLHYEYRVNGVHQNPRTVSLPPADPVPAEFHQDFVAHTTTLWRQLDLYQQTRYAATID